MDARSHNTHSTVGTPHGSVAQASLAAVLFDLDDTLYAERDYVTSGFKSVARWLGQRGASDACDVYHFLSAQLSLGAHARAFDRLIDHFDLSDSVSVVRLVDVYRQHFPDIQPLPGVRKLLAWLRSHCRVALVSDGYLDVQRRKLAALKLGDLLDTIVFSDQWGPDAWKPSTRPFREALARLQIQPHQALYVADNPNKDFLGARRAGLRSVRLRMPGGIYFHDRPIDSRYAPDVEVPSVDQLYDWLLLNLQRSAVS